MVSTHLQAVAVHEHLGHRAASHIDVFDLLRGDVLSLRQLKDVLLPVDDLQDAALRHTRTLGSLGTYPTSSFYLLA